MGPTGRRGRSGPGSGLLLVAVRSLAHRRGRTLLSILGVALGVGLLFGSLATSAGIDRSVLRAVDDLLGRSDLRIAALGEGGLSPETVAAITGAPGVEVASPELVRRSFVVRPPTSSVAAAAFEDPVVVLGVEPGPWRLVHAPPLVEGRWLAASERGLVIGERLASAIGAGIGSDLTVLAGTNGPLTLPVVGIVGGGDPVDGADGRLVIVALPIAARAFDVEAVGRVDVIATAGVDTRVLAESLDPLLVREPYLAITPATLAADLRASTADFGALAALIAAISLFVAAFLIFNTLSMTVVERIRDVGLLRAAGATRRAIAAIFLLQGVLIGAAGGLLGLVLGWAFAVAISAAAGRVGAVPVGILEIPARGVLLALGIGLAVTLAAALEPARRAALVPPVEALRARVDPSLLRPRLRWIALVFVVVAVAGLLAWPSGMAAVGLVRPLLVYGVLIAGTLILPALLGPLGALAGVPFRLVLPLEERIGRRSLVRDRERATLTLGALTIGIATIVALLVVGENVRAAAGARVGAVVPGDIVVASVRPVGVDEPVADELAAVPGVGRVSPIGLFEVALGGRRIDAAAVRGADLLADGLLRFVAGERAPALRALDEGGAAIFPANLAGALGIGVGDTVRLLGSSAAPRDLTVVGLVAASLPGRGGEVVLVGWPEADALGVLGADLFAVRLDPARDAAALAATRTELDAVARSLALQPRDLGAIEGEVGLTLGRIFELFDALALVAVLVAGLGIVNTLTMSVAERVREIGVLRALGMSRRRVGRLVVVEAGILGLVGSVAGLVLGLVAGGATSVLSVGRADPATVGDLVVPVVPIAATLVLGVLVATLAAWQPARIAARVPIVRSLRFD